MTQARRARPQSAPERVAFEYAILRAVPRVERGECVNVGIVLYCQAADFLDCGFELDLARLLALDPSADVDAIMSALDTVRYVCGGDPQGGSAAEGEPRVRFGWLTAPRSTVIQPGPIHSGMTADPHEHLARLVERLVR